MVQPYNSTETTTACKNSQFILSKRWDIHMVATLLTAVHVLPMCMMK